MRRTVRFPSLRRVLPAMLILAAWLLGVTDARAQAPALAPPTLDEAQRLFYGGNYEGASAMALALRGPDALMTLASFELRTSALHFQLRRLMGNGEDQEKAFKACAGCPAIFDVFLEETRRGREVAHARLAERPADPDTLFFLGKIDLNYIWLRLGTLGERTGWNEYWEARKSLDAVIKARPGHLRAQVARAWIDYIVDTKMTWGFRWVLGGGNKKKALATIRAAAQGESDDFARIEAAFGLWDIENREKNTAAAVEVARGLARRFPENQELARFLAAH